MRLRPWKRSGISALLLCSVSVTFAAAFSACSNSASTQTLSPKQEQNRLVHFCALDANLSPDTKIFISSFEQQFGNPPIDLSTYPTSERDSILEELSQLVGYAPK